MKKLLVLLVCVLMVCAPLHGADATSILRVESIEDALTWKSDEFNGSVCVVVGTITEHMTGSHHDPAYTSQLLAEKVIYGEVEEVYIKKINDI
ncbi:MAG: hypothetical protein IJ044_03400, partial [Oscillospiraceae bacterium]|nr:hypothetical protein [Oscillospiraceae bacterium]